MTADQLPFAPGALLLDGFFLLRATVQPTTGANERRWAVDLVHHIGGTDGPQRIYLFANLQAVQEGWLIGSTVGGRIHLPSDVNLEQLPLDAFEAECRRLFEETLWDATSSYARQLCAMGRVEGIQIPASCPRKGWASGTADAHKSRPDQAAS